MTKINVNDLDIVQNNLHFNKKKGLVYPFLDFQKQKKEILKSKIFPKNTRQEIINYYNNLSDKSRKEVASQDDSCLDFCGKKKEQCCKKLYPQNDYLYTTCLNSNKYKSNYFIVIIFIFLILNIIIVYVNL